MLEARLPGLSSFARVADHRLYVLNKFADAQVFYESQLNASDVLEFESDTVILATGSRWRDDCVGSTNFEPFGVPGAAVITPEQVFEGQLEAGPSRIVVYDDDHFYMASAVAESLQKHGHGVSYVTPSEMVSWWTDLTLDQDRIISRFNELGIDIHVNTKLRSSGDFVSTLTGAPFSIPCQKIAFVGARTPANSLFQELTDLGPDKELYLAGDCLVPGIIQAAVLSGHTVAREILTGTSARDELRREHLSF